MVYVLVDTSRTQEYVFASRRLFGIRNASRLLAATDDKVGRALSNSQRIRALGGVIIARFDGNPALSADDEASRFEALAREAYRDIGVSVEVATVRLDSPPTSFYQDVLRPLLRHVRTLKDSPCEPDPGKPSSLLAVPCESSGLEAAERVIRLGPSEPRVSAPEAKKWALGSVDDDAAVISRAIHKKWDLDLPCARSFEEIVAWRTGAPAAAREETIAGEIGLVFADVNGLGGLLRHVARDEAFFARFAVDLQEVLKNSLAAAAADVLGPELARRGRAAHLAVPMLPVFIGGDDLCFAVAAPYALPLSACVLATFEDASASLLEGLDGQGAPSRLTLSAGVVIAPFKYPILAAGRLGRELESRAKRIGRYAARLQKYDLPSLLDFHVVKNSILGGLEDARGDLAWLSGGRVTEWFGGPYLVGSGPAATTFVGLEALIEASRLLAELPSTKVHDLRAILIRGVTQSIYEDWVSHLSNGERASWERVCTLLQLQSPTQGLPVRASLPRSSAVLDAIDLVSFLSR